MNFATVVRGIMGDKGKEGLVGCARISSGEFGNCIFVCCVLLPKNL